MSIDDRAHLAATSPANDLPEPTEGQKIAGNYRKGPLALHGLRISIENPQGSTRAGVGKDGVPWENQMQAHYGYIRSTKGRDKDHIDIFVGPDAESADRVHVIDQVDPETGKFDEHKVMLGWPDKDSASDAYMSNYAPDWRGFGAVTEMPMGAFKKWALAPGRRVKSLSREIQYYADGGPVLPDDQSKPAFITPMIGKRSKNDREASANVPAAAVRGWAAGVAGLPGDVIELMQLIHGAGGAAKDILSGKTAAEALKNMDGIHSPLPTSDFYRDWLPGKAYQDRDSEAMRKLLGKTGPQDDKGAINEIVEQAVSATAPLGVGTASKALRKLLTAPQGYADGGTVNPINDFSDAQYAAAREWAQGRTGAEVAAKGMELGLTADQLGRVTGFTGADVTNAGYGSTAGLAAPFMNNTFDSGGAHGDNADVFHSNTYGAGTGLNSGEMANAKDWAIGKSAAEVQAKLAELGGTWDQATQVFGDQTSGGLAGYGSAGGWNAALGKKVWDGTQWKDPAPPGYETWKPDGFNQTPAPSATGTPWQVSALPTAPAAPPTGYAPGQYLPQTVTGSQKWMTSPGNTGAGWAAKPFAEGGSVAAPTLDFAELKRQYDPYLFDNNDPYWFTPAAGLDTFGWRIGGSDIAGIKRGAAALGMTYQDAVGGGGGEGENNAGTPEQYGGWDALARAENQPQWMRTQLVNTQTGGESGSADNWVEQTSPDLAAIRTHFGLPEDASEADIFRAVNQKYGDLYSITGTRNGWDNADLTNGIEDPRTHITANFKDAGDGTLQATGVSNPYSYKRTSFLQDIAPVLSVVMPALGGMGMFNWLSSPISSTLTQAGLPTWLADKVPGMLGKAAMSEATGGDWRSAISPTLLLKGMTPNG